MLSSSPYNLCASVFAFATDSEQDGHMRHFEAVNLEGTLLITATADEDQYVPYSLQHCFDCNHLSTCV